MSQKILPLWTQPTGASFAIGNGAHQFFSRDNNAFLTESDQVSTLKDTGQGIWFKIPCSGYDNLHIAGKIVLSNSNGYDATAGVVSVAAYAFYRNPGALVTGEIDKVLNNDLLTAVANAEMGHSRLQCLSYGTLTNDRILIFGGMDWTAAPVCLDTTEVAPIFKTSGAATGDTAHWIFEVGQANKGISGNAEPGGYTRTLDGAGNLTGIIGLTEIYLAIKCVNNGAALTGGSGTPEFGGQISAILSNSQRS